MRLKGITPAAVVDHIHRVRRTASTYDEWRMFQKSYSGDPITLDNGANNKVRFQNNKGQDYSTYTGKQTRKVQFA